MDEFRGDRTFRVTVETAKQQVSNQQKKQQHTFINCTGKISADKYAIPDCI